MKGRTGWEHILSKGTLGRYVGNHFKNTGGVSGAERESEAALGSMGGDLNNQYRFPDLGGWAHYREKQAELGVLEELAGECGIEVSDPMFAHGVPVKGCDRVGRVVTDEDEDDPSVRERLSASIEERIALMGSYEDMCERQRQALNTGDTDGYTEAVDEEGRYLAMTRLVYRFGIEIPE